MTPQEIKREYQRIYRQKNPDKVKEYQRAYRERMRKENPEQVREYMRKWRIKQKKYDIAITRLVYLYANKELTLEKANEILSSLIDQPQS